MNQSTHVFSDLISPRQINSDNRDELYWQVGRALVSLSELEQYLAEVFIYLNGAIPEEHSAKLFYGAEGFADKVRLIDIAVLKECSEGARTGWAHISRQITRHRFLRNIAAHSSVRFIQEETPDRRISLVNQARNKWSSSKKRSLEIQDFGKTLNQLDLIVRSVRRFSGILVRDLGRTK
jgi:hypothetical protein